MLEKPDGADLLACAREVLKSRILAAVSGDQQRELLMVINAMGIAQREMQFRAQATAQAAHQPSLQDASLTRLAHAIRQGQVDPGQPERAAVWQQLRAMTRQRLLVSNPKALDSNH
ncbi:DUF6285 domain-containing protein [Limnobacter sp.]|uniref:DUF6285 domain-containing protein n=1 Tax=Limnobacter sp. TaxID=2003368 RepID=UPI003515C8D6